MASEILTAAGNYISGNLPSGFLSDDERARAVADALLEYGRNFPLVTVATFAGDGTQLYDLSDQSLTGWVEKSSTISLVEYPYASADLGENVLRSDEWEISEHPTNGATLRFLEETPAAAELVLVRYTAPHADADPASSVDRDHVGAVAKLAASNMALIMSARDSGGNESTIGADSWNHVSSSENWGRLSKRLRAEYAEAVGIASQSSGGGAVMPAGSTRAYDDDDLTTHGYGRLTRRRRRV